MTNQRHIVVVGGGASGLMAAITAARSGAKVTVLEAGERVGRPVLVSGDGRCNIGNTETQSGMYRNAPFVAKAFSVCSPQEALAVFKQLGLLLREEGQGRLYPTTGKASTVVDVMRTELDRLGVSIRCECEVSAIEHLQDVWKITCRNTTELEADAVIISCGGAVQASLLSRNVPLRTFEPTLGPVETNTEPLRGLDKVRARVRLSCNDFTEVGEVTFRTYGMSGIVAFNLSRKAHVGDVVTLNFLPDIPSAHVAEFLAARAQALNPRTWEQMCCGMFLPLVSRAVLRACGIDYADAFESEKLEAFAHCVAEFPLEYCGIGDTRLCQAQRGGVEVDAVNPETMQVVNHDGLYCTGEALDVDAPCGGYNLAWAWSSGVIAGQHAAQPVSAKD